MEVRAQLLTPVLVTWAGQDHNVKQVQKGGKVLIYRIKSKCVHFIIIILKWCIGIRNTKIIHIGDQHYHLCHSHIHKCTLASNCFIAVYLKGNPVRVYITCSSIHVLMPVNILVQMQYCSN